MSRSCETALAASRIAVNPIGVVGHLRIIASKFSWEQLGSTADSIAKWSRSLATRKLWWDFPFSKFVGFGSVFRVGQSTEFGATYPTIFFAEIDKILASSSELEESGRLRFNFFCCHLAQVLDFSGGDHQHLSEGLTRKSSSHLLTFWMIEVSTSKSRLTSGTRFFVSIA
jgi:hypothetical protein